MKWIEAIITINTEDVEKVLLVLDTVHSDGCIETVHEEDPTVTDLTMYLPREKTELEWQMLIGKTLEGTEIPLHRLMVKEVSDEAWLNEWQQFIPAVEILPSLVIRPVWQSYEPKIGDKVFVIDSKLSFGLGDHETTRCCAKLMKRYGMQAQSCLDIGTGTGILLLIASFLKIPHLYGVDIDKEASQQARQNMKLNGVGAHIFHGNLDDAFEGESDLIVANLTVDPLKVLLPQIGPKLSPEGVLIISGIIDDRYDEIMPFIMNHWSIVEEVVDGPWHTFALKRK